MNWYEILVGAVGLLGGTTGMLSLYTAQPKKKALEIENFKKILDETQEEREKVKNEYNEYIEKTNAKIEKLEIKIDDLDKNVNEKIMAINSAYRCKFPSHIEECPVIKTLKQFACDKCK